MATAKKKPLTGFDRDRNRQVSAAFEKLLAGPVSNFGLIVAVTELCQALELCHEFELRLCTDHLQNMMDAFLEEAETLVECEETATDATREYITKTGA